MNCYYMRNIFKYILLHHVFYFKQSKQRSFIRANTIDNVPPAVTAVNPPVLFWTCSTFTRSFMRYANWNLCGGTCGFTQNRIKIAIIRSCTHVGVIELVYAMGLSNATTHTTREVYFICENRITKVIIVSPVTYAICTAYVCASVIIFKNYIGAEKNICAKSATKQWTK